MDWTKVCDTQNDIIKIQSDIIDDLFLQIMQYATIEEEEAELELIEKAVKLREEIKM